MTYLPLIALLVGVVTVIGMIVALRLNAFVALTIAAMVVAGMATTESLTQYPEDLAAMTGEVWSEAQVRSFVASNAPARVAKAFGAAAGNIAIVIALASIIGKCLMDSGAADRIVRSFLKASGQKGAPVALASSGFVLSIPVFFDTVFYLLVPLARSLWRSTRKNYMLYILAIGTGAAITHTLVPPTPGPLVMAENLGVDLGTMIMVGTVVALATAVTVLPVCYLFNRRMDLPMRPYAGEEETRPLDDAELPPLWLSLAPIVLPVLLISAQTIAKTMSGQGENAAVAVASRLTGILGNPNFALLLSTGVAMWVLAAYRKLSLADLAKTTETALMSGGVIILITAAGGAFGAALQQAGVKQSILGLVGPESQSMGLTMLVLGFGISCILKIAQGSSTVAMIVTSSMIAAMGTSPEALGCHPVYLCTAIGGGSLVGSWMNDSGFWIVSRMSGLTEVETLKAWTVILVIVGFLALGYSLLFATLLPLV
ncbi:MAG: GntP family permease [Thermoguttaceae bacterium]|jgi:GntP family gluconate:H+ symporter|nr:GntP family permease [Thermoguttaceae bacterium]